VFIVGWVGYATTYFLRKPLGVVSCFTLLYSSLSYFVFMNKFNYHIDQIRYGARARFY
jgi:hypothetical protein